MSVSLHLDSDAALVLFELLASRKDAIWTSGLNVAEIHALNLLEGALEKQLSAPFAPDYKVLLENAKRSLVERCGPIDR